MAVDLSGKRRATAEALAQYDGDWYVARNGRFHVNPVRDILTEAEFEVAQRNLQFWTPLLEQGHGLETDDGVVSRQRIYGPVKDQGPRGTCACFAMLAGMEGLYRRKNREVTLSEQYANWLFMKSLNLNWCYSGFRILDARSLLKSEGVCEESKCPYIYRTDGMDCGYQMPTETIAAAKYRLSKAWAVAPPKDGDHEFSAALELIIGRGFDVALAFEIAWDLADGNLVHDIMLDDQCQPIRTDCDHAMLLVGFDRRPPKPFFICRNSWGVDPEQSDQGYWRVSYDYFDIYSKYAVVFVDAEKS